MYYNVVELKCKKMSKRRFYMKAFSKITAVALVFVLALGCLISCNTTGGKVESYTANVRTTFSSTDPAMAEAIAALNVSDTTISVWGDNIAISSSAKIGDVSMDKTYTLADDVLYSDTKLVAEGKTVSNMKKAPFDSANRAELLAKVGAGASINIEDFNKVNAVEIASLECYTCSSIKDDAKASLTAIFAAKLGEVAAVTLSDAEYYVEMSEDKVQSYILNARFEVAIDGTSFDVNMTIECEYDYKSGAKILAPANAADFDESTYEDIIG